MLSIKFHSGIDAVVRTGNSGAHEENERFTRGGYGPQTTTLRMCLKQRDQPSPLLRISQRSGLWTGTRGLPTADCHAWLDMGQDDLVLKSWLARFHVSNLKLRLGIIHSWSHIHILRHLAIKRLKNANLAHKQATQTQKWPQPWIPGASSTVQHPEPPVSSFSTLIPMSWYDAYPVEGRVCRASSTLILVMTQECYQVHFKTYTTKVMLRLVLAPYL